MPLDLQTVESLAPDQASLNAASKLMKPAKWVMRGRHEPSGLLWGECQGSGSNPYRVIVDSGDHGYKCTCPSRKFPCKHVLALMWMLATDSASFPGLPEPPDWVLDWVGRRRKTSSEKPPDNTPRTSVGSINAIVQETPAPPPDPKEAERRAKAAANRAAQSHQLILDGLSELEHWIADQLRLGLASLLEQMQERCRRIGARLVDARAAALASRVDEMPSRILRHPAEERPDALLIELGKLLLLLRAYRTDSDRPEIRMAVATSPKRDEILEAADTVRLSGRWEVIAGRNEAQRDGLIRQETWLLHLGNKTRESPIFALLLDFFPAATGNRGPAFTIGDQFAATIVYYPARFPVRALIAERGVSLADRLDWPSPVEGNPLAPFHRWLAATPWGLACPILLPPGRVGMTPAHRYWWQTEDTTFALPLEEPPPDGLLACDLQQTAALWDGASAQWLASQTFLGSCYLS